MQNTHELKQSEKKDHYHFVINGCKMGEWEVSDLRHLIECIDNKLPWKIDKEEIQETPYVSHL